MKCRNAASLLPICCLAPAHDALVLRHKGQLPGRMHRHHLGERFPVHEQIIGLQMILLTVKQRHMIRPQLLLLMNDIIIEAFLIILEAGLLFGSPAAG